MGIAPPDLSRLRTELYRFAPGETIPADRTVRLSAFLYLDRSTASVADRVRAEAGRVLADLLDGGTVVRSEVAPLASPGRFDVNVAVEGAGLDGATTGGEVREAAIYALSRALAFAPWEWGTTGDTPEEEAFYGLAVEDTGRRVVLGERVRVRSGDLTTGEVIGAVEGGVRDSAEDVASGASAIVGAAGALTLKALAPVLLVLLFLVVLVVVLAAKGALGPLLGAVTGR